MGLSSKQALLLAWVFGLLLIVIGLNIAVNAWFDRAGRYRLFLLGFGIVTALWGVRVLARRTAVAAQFEQLSRRR